MTLFILLQVQAHQLSPCRLFCMFLGALFVFFLSFFPYFSSGKHRRLPANILSHVSLVCIYLLLRAHLGGMNIYGPHFCRETRPFPMSLLTPFLQCSMVITQKLYTLCKPLLFFMFFVIYLCQNSLFFSYF